MCVYVGGLVCVCVCGWVGVCVCMWVGWCVCVCVCACVYVCACVCAFVFVHVRARMCVCMCVHECVLVYVCVYSTYIRNVSLVRTYIHVVGVHHSPKSCPGWSKYASSPSVSSCDSLYGMSVCVPCTAVPRT